MNIFPWWSGHAFFFFGGYPFSLVLTNEGDDVHCPVERQEVSPIHSPIPHCEYRSRCNDIFAKLFWCERERDDCSNLPSSRVDRTREVILTRLIVRPFFFWFLFFLATGMAFNCWTRGTERDEMFVFAGVEKEEKLTRLFASAIHSVSSFPHPLFLSSFLCVIFWRFLGSFVFDFGFFGSFLPSGISFLCSFLSDREAWRSLAISFRSFLRRSTWDCWI